MSVPPENRWLTAGWYPRQVIFRKDTPRLVRVFLLHQKIPGLCLRVPRKRINKRMLGVGEHELDRVTATRAVSESL